MTLDDKFQENFQKRNQKNLKKADNKHLVGRTYNDYKIYIDDNPNAFITQMDTVYNDEPTGPFIQTFKFIPLGILFALYQTEKTSSAMKDGVDILETI